MKQIVTSLIAKVESKTGCVQRSKNNLRKVGSKTYEDLVLIDSAAWQ